DDDRTQIRRRIDAETLGVGPYEPLGELSIAVDRVDEIGAVTDEHLELLDQDEIDLVAAEDTDGGRSPGGQEVLVCRALVHRVAQDDEAAARDGEEHVALRGEVPEERPCGDVACPGDVVGRDVVVAPFSEQPERNLLDLARDESTATIPDPFLDD